MQKNSLFTREQKYRLALFGILVISSMISIGLFVARTTPSKNGPYTSLILNLFLAWIPFALAWIAYISTHLPKTLMVMLFGICAVLWLLFFPNALYILTDFQHLAIKDTVTPIWYDVIMLLWFSWNGLFLGLASMYLMQNLVARWLGHVLSWIFVVVVTILGSLGVYMGRFLQWNSWEILIDPLDMPSEFFRKFSAYHDAQAFPILFALFFLFVYITLFIFARLMNEHSSQN